MFQLVVFCLAIHTTFGGLPEKWIPGLKEGPVPYIVGGEIAEEGKYPYQVSLHSTFASRRTHYCGASVLTKNWILTAAHCCAAGTYDILVGSNSLINGTQIYKTHFYKIHPEYDPKNNWKNDICLIKSTKSIQFSSIVQPVILPPQGKELKNGDFLNATGWGYTKPDSAVTPDSLQVGKNFIYIPNKKCEALSNITMFDGYLCAAGNKNGQGMCQGDSGGPLIKDGVQYGIASFIFMPCGNPIPDFFARVSKYIDWIKQTIGKEAIELKFSS